jgi:YD repeat-containing protein
VTTGDDIIQTHSRLYDTLNRLNQNIGAGGQITIYGYDDNGNLTSITDPLDQQTLRFYDAFNRLDQITDAETGIVSYDYDVLDPLTTVTDPLNHSSRNRRSLPAMKQPIQRTLKNHGPTQRPTPHRPDCQR